MLFEEGDVIELTPAMNERNNAQNTRYIAAIQQELSKRLNGLYFTHHIEVIAFGVVATFVAALCLAVMAEGRDLSGAIFLQCGLCLPV